MILEMIIASQSALPPNLPRQKMDLGGQAHQIVTPDIVCYDAGIPSVDGRFRSKSIILTSNRAMTDWPALFTDPVTANAILDRFAHTSHQIVLKGQSYRKKLQVQTEEE